MKLSKPNIPKELDADVAMSVIISHAGSILGKELTYNYEFKGVHDCTALGNDVSLSLSYVFTIAGFFQENQLFYVVYDPETENQHEVERIYLPQCGVECLDFVSVKSYSDTLLYKNIKKHGDSIMSQELNPIKFNGDRVIN